MKNTASVRGSNEYRAKKWALAHGYHGKPGGWIYTSTGRPVVQGWWKFYQRYGYQIDREFPRTTPRQEH